MVLWKLFLNYLKSVFENMLLKDVSYRFYYLKPFFYIAVAEAETKDDFYLVYNRGQSPDQT